LSEAFLHLLGEPLRLSEAFLHLLGELLRFFSKVWGLIDQALICSISLARLGLAALCSEKIKILNPSY
jgi:hypothetical protein